jgi:hypothetical protein
MPVTLILHIADGEPVMGEVEEIPKADDQMILLTNPRRRDGKDLGFLAHGVVAAIWPVHRLNFIQILPSEREEEIIGFVRE